MNLSPVFFLPVFGAVALVLLNCLYRLIGFLYHQRLLVNWSHNLRASYPHYGWNNEDVADDPVADDPVASPPVSAPTSPLQAVGDALAYDGQGKTTFVNDVCMICLVRFMDGDVCQVLVNCKHVYHRECIDEWMSRNSCCPICRVPASVIRVSKLSETPVT